MDIWERAQTFPTKYIEKFRQQLNETTARTYHSVSLVSLASAAHDARPSIVETASVLTPYVAASTTPPGSPPPGLPGSMQKPPQPSTAQPVGQQQSGSSTNIMEVLASIAKQSAVPTPPNASATPPAPASTSTPAAPAPVPAYGAAPATLPYQQPQQQAYTAPTAPASLPASVPGFPAQLLAGLGAPGANGAPTSYSPVVPQAAPPAAAPAPTPAPGPAGGAAPGINQVMLIKTLIDQGLQPDQISAILQTVSGAQSAPQAAPTYPAAPVQPQDGGWDQGRGYGVSDRRGYPERSRSRSPDRWGRDARGGQDRNGPGRPSSRDRARDRPDYRHRSPMGRRDRGTPDVGQEPKKKWVEYDRTLRPNTIKGKTP